MSQSLIAALIFTLSASGYARPSVDDWSIEAERSDFRRTGGPGETDRYLDRLAEALPRLDRSTMGTTASGRPIPVLTVTPPDGNETHARILVLAGIHAGEIEGKDAGLMLIRDLLTGESGGRALDHVELVFVPVFNMDGFHRFGPHNRINQNGPERTGWRTTDANLNLNRDFLKADTPEMRALLKLMRERPPDLLLDLHNTDGADYQYQLTYILDDHAVVPEPLREQQRHLFQGCVFPDMERKGHSLAPYLWLRDRSDPTHGFREFISTPRYSSGYGPIRNMPSLTLEAHTLKDYRTRVTATYEFLSSTLACVGRDPESLARAAASARIAAAELAGTRVPLSVGLEETPRSFPFKAVGWDRRLSRISGDLWISYDPEESVELTVPFHRSGPVEARATIPAYYLLPPALESVAERLSAHGVTMRRTERPRTLVVDTYRFDDLRWRNTPYEGRQMVSGFETEPVAESMEFPAGSWLVPTNQPLGRVIVHMLEPEAPDSLFRWGFFNRYLERTEYAEPRVMEDIARRMLADDPQLAREFRDRIASDREFAASPEQRLDFFYRRTPWFDERFGRYPVGRLSEWPPEDE